MCIAMPMQVVSLSPGHALVSGRGVQRRVDTGLVGAVQPGDWLLVFIDSARAVVDAARAAEVNATLDLLEAAMQQHGAAHDAAAFELPSAMSADRLAALAGKQGTHT